MKATFEEGEPPTNLARPAAKTSTPRIQLKTILVPIDFSRAAMQALRYAMALAKRFKAEVHLLHVNSPEEAAPVPNAGHVLRECAEAVAFTQEKLGIISRSHVPAFWPQNCHVVTGKAYEEICAQARELDAQLIVLATRGNRGLKRIALGSTAERVVRFSPCPVLVVRERRRPAGMPDVVTTKKRFRMRRLLVPVDFSPCGLAAATFAAQLATAFGAKLRLFHVARPPTPVVIDRVSANMTGRLDLDGAKAKRDLQAFAKQDLFRGIKCETELAIGNAADEICRASGNPNVDLVVTSTHGRTGFNHLMLGSVAEQVVRYSGCPVLVVPSRCRVE